MWYACLTNNYMRIRTLLCLLKIHYILSLPENRGFSDSYLTMHGSHVIEGAWMKLWNIRQLLMGVPKSWL